MVIRLYIYIHFTGIFIVYKIWAIQGYTGVYRRVYRGIQGYTVVYRSIQEYTEVYRGIQRYTEVYGSVYGRSGSEFCII